MLKIGIIGGRIAGSRLAGILAGQGIPVRIFDHRTDREKACGGGLTYKAYRGLKDLLEGELPAGCVTRMKLVNPAFPDGVITRLDPPLLICSRRALDDCLRGAAVRSGAEWIKEKVIDIAYSNRQWSIKTVQGSYGCDILVGADGVRSLLKCRFDRPLAKKDLSLALGYYVPGSFHQDTILCRFFEPPFQGYLWSFPRPDHLSVGIMDGLDRADSQEMRREVQRHIRQHYPGIDPGQCREYAATVPTLREESLRDNTICGPHWAVVGDAAGFADPITGEGIYYALRSAELLADCLKAGSVEDYPARCRKDFVYELRRAARWKRSFYRGIGGRFPLHRMAVCFAARSCRFRSLLSAWAAGSASYAGMPRLVLKSLPRIALESLTPGKDQPTE